LFSHELLISVLLTLQMLITYRVGTPPSPHTTPKYMYVLTYRKVEVNEAQVVVSVSEDVGRCGDGSVFVFGPLDQELGI
jgi:hypothetical protein